MLASRSGAVSPTNPFIPPSNCFTDDVLGPCSSTAIDYPKTGVHVPFLNLPKPPPEKPDFSSKESAFIKYGKAAPDTYPSTKALGILFRMVGTDLVQSKDLDVAGLNVDWTETRGEDEPEPVSKERLDAAGSITHALRTRYHFDPVEPALKPEMALIIPSFTDELYRIARMCSLSRQALSEHELLLGTIASAAKDGRRKKECLERLVEATSLLYGRLRRDVAGGAEGEERVRRLWAAWVAGREFDDGWERWGVRVFGWVVLGGLMEAVEEVGRG